MTMTAQPNRHSRTVEPEAPTRASVPERFRRLKWNEVVWSCDFVADERLGLQPLEGPSGFRAGSFARPIYRREEIVRFRATSAKKTKQNHKTSMRKYTLAYEDRDVINNPSIYAEMVQKRAEPFALCRGQRAHAGRFQRGRSRSLPAQSRSGAADRRLRRPTGLATRITMSNA